MQTVETTTSNPNSTNAIVMCRVGAKCQQNFGEEILRNCTVTEVTENGFTVVADGLGWKMSNIPLDKFRPHGT